MNLIIIPRHIERGQLVLGMAKDRGFEDVIAMKEIVNGRRRIGERVIVVDMIGELFAMYSLATVVFCGGSLVPRGGQNILEPAAWGKVIFHGPFMDDFRDEKDLLEKSGAGVTVRNAEDLLKGIMKVLSDPESLAKRGEKGRHMVIANMGAAERYTDLISLHIKQIPFS
jgi:3-deoxy-D-manno-octulosonic-acid transferase